jgi:hypothetical protein
MEYMCLVDTTILFYFNFNHLVRSTSAGEEETFCRIRGPVPNSLFSRPNIPRHIIEVLRNL